jgi:predicted Zn-dependent protease
LSGLIKRAKSSDELAGIIAHEIAHARQRHVLQGILSAASTTVFIHFLTGGLNSAFAVDPSFMISMGALTFDRRMEKEADQGALDQIIGLGLNPKEVANFFQREASVPENLKFLSTHPSDNERIALFKSKKLNYIPVPILSSLEWKSLQSYCEFKKPMPVKKRSQKEIEKSVLESARDEGRFQFPGR